MLNPRRFESSLLQFTVSKYLSSSLVKNPMFEIKRGHFHGEILDTQMDTKNVCLYVTQWFHIKFWHNKKVNDFKIPLKAGHTEQSHLVCSLSKRRNHIQWQHQPNPNRFYLMALKPQKRPTRRLKREKNHSVSLAFYFSFSFFEIVINARIHKFGHIQLFLKKHRERRYAL